MGENFHYFPLLPTELRLIIWKLCLPHRIAEYDPPFFQLNGDCGHQACCPMRTTAQNNQLPLIAFVNSESRQVALENGQVPEIAFEGKSWKFGQNSKWVQPLRDRLHLNWNREHESLAQSDIDPPSEVLSFLGPVLILGMRASVAADTIYPFILETLFDGYVAPNYGYPVPDSNYLPAWYFSQPDVTDLARYAYSFYDFPKTIDVAMVVVSLHVSRENALKSGLFGLLGDAPVQMVGLDEASRLGEYEALSKMREPGEDNEPELEKLFSLFKTSNFKNAVDSWIKMTQALISIAIWKQAQEERNVTGEYPAQAPNRNHPWALESGRSIPELRPQIMLRYCENKCNTKGLVRDEYGFLI